MGDSDKSLFWYALQVRGNREHAVTTMLDHKGYEHYAPTYNTKPLFPGYVFCRFDYDAHDCVRTGGSVIATPGVIRILGGIHPISIPTKEIEAIRLALAARLRPEPWPFQNGQNVKIEAGPLKGVSGMVIRADGKQRLVLSIELLRRSVAVTVEAEWISSVEVIGQALENARSCLSQRADARQRDAVSMNPM